MKETAFYQVRQDNTLPLNELAILIRKAFMSLYPGTVFDEDLTALYGGGPIFFLNRSHRAECIAVVIAPEPVELHAVPDIMRLAGEAQQRIQELRSGVSAFMVSLVASQITAAVIKEIETRFPGWSLYEYLLLQSETEEGLALKPVIATRPRALVQKPLIEPTSAQESKRFSAMADKRLSPEELSALIDLSLGLEMRSRGKNWDAPGSRQSDFEA